MKKKKMAEERGTEKKLTSLLASPPSSVLRPPSAKNLKPPLSLALSLSLSLSLILIPQTDLPNGGGGGAGLGGGEEGWAGHSLVMPRMGKGERGVGL